MADDFFAGLDALEADRELLESIDERKQFDKEFETELLKQWSAAVKGKSTKQLSSAVGNGAVCDDLPQISSQTVLTSSPPPLEDGGDEPTSRKKTTEITAQRRSRNLLPANLIPTAARRESTATLVNSDDAMSSSQGEGDDAEGSRPNVSRKPTLDLRHLKPSIAAAESKDQKHFRECFEKLKKQIHREKEREAKRKGSTGAGAPSRLAIQSDLLDGLVFVVVWSPRGWNIVQKILEKVNEVGNGCCNGNPPHDRCLSTQIHWHGGTFLLKYGPGVTHLLCADDMTEGDFLKHSGFISIEDIPKDVICVRVKWLHETITVSVAPGGFPGPTR
jgi:hypothetical protein